jgi:hypothetical protein
MNKPTSGYYRKLLPMYPDVRIAFTHMPIIGCAVIENTAVLNALNKSDDKHAQYYVHGLTTGSMVTIVETAYEKTWANNGELFFRS